MSEYQISGSYQPRADQEWNRKAVTAFVLELSVLAVGFLTLLIGVIVVFTFGSSNSMTSDEAYNAGGVLGDIFSIITLAMAIVGLVFAHRAMNSALKNLRGRGLAVAALVLGYAYAGLFLLRVIVSFLVGFLNAL